MGGLSWEMSGGEIGSYYNTVAYFTIVPAGLASLPRHAKWSDWQKGGQGRHVAALPGRKIWVMV